MVVKSKGNSPAISGKSRLVKYYNLAGYMAWFPSFPTPVSRIDIDVEVSNRAPSVEELRVLQRRIAEISGAF